MKALLVELGFFACGVNDSRMVKMTSKPTSHNLGNCSGKSSYLEWDNFQLDFRGTGVSGPALDNDTITDP